MINQIKNDDILKAFIRNDCEENGICATIDEGITEDEIAIVKVDDYYNSLRLGNTPRSVDFLVSVDCENRNYVLYLIELKNISSPSGFKVSEVYQKFKTTIEDFMSTKFDYIYLNQKYHIKELLLYFVSDPYGLNKSGISLDEYSKKKNGLKLDAFLTQKPLVFNEKGYLIKPKLPNPLIQKP